jgi:hypothetical protein
LFRATLEARGGVVEPVADGFAQATRRARDGVPYAAARGARDAADRAGETAYGVLRTVQQGLALKDWSHCHVAPPQTSSFSSR